MTTTERNQIKSVIQSQAWGTMEIIRDEVIKKIQAQTKMQATVDETAMRTAYDEGQIAGINRYIQELFNTQL